MWTMLVFFAWVIWFWLLITCFGDLFRRRGASGGKKVLWVIFLIVAPYLGVFVYLIANHQGMADRNLARAQAQQQQFDDSVRQVAGGAGEIERAKKLLDSGAISQAEYDQI